MPRGGMPSAQLTEKIAGMLGDLGMGDVQIGSRRLSAAKRGEIRELRGHGDTIRVGSVVRVDWKDGSGDGAPQYVYRIFSASDGPCVQFRPMDDGPFACQASYP